MQLAAVICVAHTGIAATGGKTVHRAFAVPLDIEEQAHCQMDLESEQAQALKDIDVVIWDEATMTDLRIYKAVSKLLCHISGNFGGKTMIFSGDWKQTLPVVEGVQGPSIEKYLLPRLLPFNDSDKIEVFRLKKNMRAKDDPDYAEFVEGVGNGTNYTSGKFVKVPKEMPAENKSEIVEWLYGNRQIEDVQKIKNCNPQVPQLVYKDVFKNVLY